MPALVGVDALVTDPPYGLGDLMARGPNEKWPLWERSAGTGLSWDQEAPSLVPDLAVGFSQSIVWGGNYFPLPLVRGWLVWDKMVREFSSGHCELAWTSLDQPIRRFYYSHGQLANEGKLHPTQKPLPLMRWCVGMTQGVVLDPFMGSGTTLRAAKDLGRQSVGIELDERYCEMAAERCRQESLFSPTNGQQHGVQEPMFGTDEAA